MVGGDSQNPKVPVADPLVGRTLNGRFNILEPIGVGGMGRVYKALQKPLDRVVALKVLNPNFPSAKDPNFQKRFLREASLTSKLRHPNTVTVIDYGQTDDGIFYIAMELLEGRTLAQLLGQVGPLPWTRALSIGQQICRSLREAHNLGIVHRDLKPANIMLLNEADQDLVKVLDFGLVKSVATPAEGSGPSPEVTQNGTFLGSPQYMAPEQARNHADGRSDVYSLGVVLFQMLMGRPPFVSRDHIELIFSHYKELPPAFAQVRPDLQVPGDIEGLVRKCLEKDPAKRFQSMDDLLEAMRQASMQAGGHSGIFRRPGSAQTGQYQAVGTPGANTTGPHAAPQFGGHSTGPHAAPQFGGHSTGPHAAPQFGGHSTGPHASPQLGGTGPHPAQPNTTGPHATPLFGGVSEAPAGAAQQGKKGLVIAAAVGAVVLVAVLALTLGGGKKDAPAEGAASAGAQAADARGVDDKVEPLPAVQGAAARFKLLSQPSGASVYYQGKNRGTTPFVLEVPLGADGSVTVEVTFQLDGYYPETVITGGSGEVVLMQKLQRRPEPQRRAAPQVSERAPARNEAPQQASAPAQAPAQAPAPAAKSVPAVASGGEAKEEAALASASPAVLGITPASLVAPIRIPAPGEIVPFDDETMNRPVKLSGKSITIPREAWAAKVEGLFIAKCTINEEGEVKNCRVLRAPQFWEKSVLETLYSSRYTPVKLQGRPVLVDYTFSINLRLPTSR